MIDSTDTPKVIHAEKDIAFLYKVSGNVDEMTAKLFVDPSEALPSKLDCLNKMPCEITYCGMQSQTYENNLRLIDSDLPEICAWMLLRYFTCGTSLISSCLKEITDANPMKYPQSFGQPFYQYKFKKLLVSSVLGMCPTKVWYADSALQSEYVIDTGNGEELHFSLLDRYKFEDYLLNNTQFESPDVNTADRGVLFESDKDWYLKLGLQIGYVR